MRGLALGVVVSLCAACTPRSHAPPAPMVRPPTPTQPAQPPALPRVPISPPVALQSLPTSPRAVWLPAEAFPVFIDANFTSVGFPALAVLPMPVAEVRRESGYGPQYQGPGNAHRIAELERGMDARPCDANGSVAPIAALHVAAGIEYAVLLDALMTLRLVGYDQLYIAVRLGNEAGASVARMGVPVNARGSARLLINSWQGGVYLELGANRSPVDCDGTTAPADARAAPLPSIKNLPDGSLDLVRLRACVERFAPRKSTLQLGLESFRSTQDTVNAVAALAGYSVVLSPARQPSALASAAAGTVSNATQVVQGLRQPFRDCYTRELGTNRDAQGSVRITIRVGPDGSVASVSVAPSGNLGSAPECVRLAAQTAHFDPPEGGSAVVVVPVTFVRTDRQAPQRGPRCTPGR